MDIYINKEWPADVLCFLLCSNCSYWRVPKLLFFQIHFAKLIELDISFKSERSHLPRTGFAIHCLAHCVQTKWVVCYVGVVNNVVILLAFLAQAAPAVEFPDGGTNLLFWPIFPKKYMKMKRNGGHLSIRQWRGKIHNNWFHNQYWSKKSVDISLSCDGGLSQMKCITKEHVYIISNTPPWILI